MIDISIFRAYDIRGNSEKQLSPELAYKIGYSLVEMSSYLKNDTNLVLVARDGRKSSETLCNALICGIRDAGCDIMYIGLVPTPILYYADKIHNPVLSIMITASHNPASDNGFKIVQNGQSFFGHMLQDLAKWICDKKWHNIKIYDHLSKFAITDVKESYFKHIFSQIKHIDSKLTIAFDPANGATGNIIKDLVKNLDCKAVIINEEIDGNFPSHSPDPSVEQNLAQLKSAVLKYNCDLGIGFDGDGDRIGVITNKGDFVLGDKLMCLYAKNLLTKYHSASVVADVKTSDMFFDYVKSLGGNPIMSKTGHSFIKNKLKESNALFAGEMSGHIFFADRNNFGYDDAIYAGLRLCEILSLSDKSLQEMIDDLPKTYGVNAFNIQVNVDKFHLIERNKRYFDDHNFDYNGIDGVRVTKNAGWWLLRASNTESAITVRYGSDSEHGLELIKHELESVLQKEGLSLPPNGD